MTSRSLTLLMWLSGLVFAGLPLRVAAEPIATTEGETPGLSLQVQELKRVSGGTVMLRFTVTNSSRVNQSTRFYYAGIDDGSQQAFILSTAQLANSTWW